MTMTLNQIVEETRQWPPEKIGELVGRLAEGLQSMGAEIGTAWKAEFYRRIEEIRTVKFQEAPENTVSARFRKILETAGDSTQ